MFLGSWTAAVVVSKIFIKQNQQAGKPTAVCGVLLCTTYTFIFNFNEM